MLVHQIKLEKKRPYSLERIFNTLRSGSRKTQVLRSTSTVNQDQHISRTIKTAPHLSKNGQMSSLSGCFTCHAFQRCSSRVKFVTYFVVSQEHFGNRRIHFCLYIGPCTLNISFLVFRHYCCFQVQRKNQILVSKELGPESAPPPPNRVYYMHKQNERRCCNHPLSVICDYCYHNIIIKEFL